MRKLDCCACSLLAEQEARARHLENSLPPLRLLKSCWRSAGRTRGGRKGKRDKGEGGEELYPCAAGRYLYHSARAEV
eukprot:751944-Hanusia_phi.AAC.2